MSFADKLKRAIKHAVGDGPRARQLSHTFYENIGSPLADAHDFEEEHARLLSEHEAWCAENAKGRYLVAIEPHHVYNDEGKLVDMHFWLVISFDLSGDAMLSRMTWPGLKRYPNAERRGRIGDAC